MTAMSQPTVESVGLGWPETLAEQADEARDVSRETSREAAGLGWPA